MCRTCILRTILMKAIKEDINKEKHTMFMDWKTQHNKDFHSFQINTILIKIPVNFFADIDNIVLKCIWKCNI